MSGTELAGGGTVGGMNINWPVSDVRRIVVAGDWHGNGIAARNAFVAAYSLGADLVVQLGDFGMWPGEDGAAFLDEVESYAQRSGIPVAWLDGNHEDFDQLLALPVDPDTGLRMVREHVWHMPRGSAWEWQGVRFRVLGGATSLDRLSRWPGTSWWLQESVNDLDLEEVSAGGDCDVLLTHDCPTGVEIPGIHHRSYADARFWPVSELERAWDHRDRIAQAAKATKPRHLWHGHFHVRYSDEARLHQGGLTSVEGLADDGSGPLSNLTVADFDDGEVWVNGLSRDMEIKELPAGGRQIGM